MVRDAVSAVPAILVVEDNERIRSAEVEALRESGYCVLSAPDGEVAVRILSEAAVDLLITDIRLPGRMNGIELARMAKQRWPRMKAMLVGIDVGNLSAEEMGAIADGGLNKPFKLGELQRRVAGLIGPAGQIR